MLDIIGHASLMLGISGTASLNVRNIRHRFAKVEDIIGHASLKLRISSATLR